MGRGLSSLQRNILQIAADNNAAGQAPFDVTAAEVLLIVHGWRPKYNAARPLDVHRSAAQRGILAFSSNQPGYKAEHGNVARSLGRLVERGLLVKYESKLFGTGYDVTDLQRLTNFYM